MRGGRESGIVPAMLETIGQAEDAEARLEAAHRADGAAAARVPQPQVDVRVAVRVAGGAAAVLERWHSVRAHTASPAMRPAATHGKAGSRAGPHERPQGLVSGTCTFNSATYNLEVI